jgi:tetratricopeptide (TPR) repeat protein
MLGSYKDALDVRQKLLEVQPRNPRRHFDVALVLLHARRIDEAKAALERALALAPDYDDARQLLATANDASTGWPAVAVSDGPTLERARWLVRLGARREAVEEYRLLVTSRGATPAIALEAARYAVVEGDLGLARTIIRLAESLARGSPELPLLEQLLEEREELRRRLEAEGRDIGALLAPYDPSGRAVPVDATPERR